jgi:cytochrome c oxidase subunit 3
MKINFPFMLVDNSLWPATTSVSALSLLLGGVMLFHMKIGGKELLIISLISLIISIYFWWKEVIIEGTYQGFHNQDVQKNLTIGFLLFVVSEALIFFSFFFAYFYNSLIPSVNVGGVWPPVGIETLDASAIPLLNTVILFMSGISVTASQHYIVAKNRKNAILYLLLTVLLGTIFLFFQFYEYKNSLFTISDSVFGASFFLLTGFHGFHVLIGVLFLATSLLRLIDYHYSENHFLNATFASIYYHFVDVVWILLFAVIYCWGSGL